MIKYLLRAQLNAVLPNGVVLHASAVAKNSSAIVFLAPSGGGKSTIAMNLSKLGYGMIADDSTIISRGTDGIVRCLPCGSMKQYCSSNAIQGAPIKHLFFIEKNTKPFVYRLQWAYSSYRAMRISCLMAFNDVTENERMPARKFLIELMSSFPVFVLGYTTDLDLLNIVQSLDE